jgi:hypothetical protein
MPWDPKNLRPAPPQYRPLEEDPNDKPGPAYDDDNPPTITDLVKAAHKARKGLKKLKLED